MLDYIFGRYPIRMCSSPRSAQEIHCIDDVAA